MIPLFSYPFPIPEFKMVNDLNDVVNAVWNGSQLQRLLLDMGRSADGDSCFLANSRQYSRCNLSPTKCSMARAPMTRRGRTAFRIKSAHVFGSSMTFAPFIPVKALTWKNGSFIASAILPFSRQSFIGLKIFLSCPTNHFFWQVRCWRSFIPVYGEEVVP